MRIHLTVLLMARHRRGGAHRRLRTPSKHEAWIGWKFDKPTAIIEAYAKGLGIGSGGGNSWEGGVTLQSSKDGVAWTTVATKRKTAPHVLESKNTVRSASAPPRVAALMLPRRHEIL